MRTVLCSSLPWLLLCSLTSRAAAQAEPAPDTAEAGPAPAATVTATPEANGQDLGDVVVTAQKREDRLLDVPISISVVTPETLAAANAKNLTELQGVVPGIYFSGDTGYGGAPIAIRGTAGTNTTLLDDPVAVYVDDVYLSSAAFASSTLVDLGAIEVVRGPQGTLQGRNATAGAVIVRTADPKSTFGGYLRESLAAPMEYRSEAAVTGPVFKGFSARAAFAYQNAEGWAKNTFDGSKLASSDTTLGRLVLLYQPTPELRIRLASTYSIDDSAPAVARWAATQFSPDMALVQNPTPTVPLSAAEQAAVRNDRYNLNRPTDTRIKTWINSLSGSWRLGPVELVSVTGVVDVRDHGRGDSDGLGVSPAQADPSVTTGDRYREGFNEGDIDSTSFSQELRVQSNHGGPLSWIAGGYYSRTDQSMFFRINNLRFTVPARQYTTYDADQQNPTYAGFADATFKIRDWLGVTGGVRYTHEEKTFSLVRNTLDYDTNQPPAPAMPAAPATPAPQAKARWNDVSYRGKLSVTPSDDLLVYGSFSKGFKSGGFNAFGNDPAFNPEELWSTEVGVKADLLRGRAWLAGAAYHNLYNGLQLRTGVGAGGVAITNAADTTINGFELEGQLSAPWSSAIEQIVQVNAAYTDATFNSFHAKDLLGVEIDAANNRLPRTPRWQFFAQSSVKFDTGTVALVPQVSARWRDTIYFYHTNQDSPVLQGEPLLEVDARLSMLYEPYKLSVAVFATNLLDARSVNGLSLTFNYPEVSFNKPRVIGVEVDWKF